MRSPALASLARGVKLLSLDAGNTIIFLDHARVARWATSRGQVITAATLIRTEGEAKRLGEEGEMLDLEWPGRDLPGARGWGKMVATMLHRADVPLATVASWLPDIWSAHARLNLWSIVPPDLVPALRAARARGIKVAVVSNSEGMLDELFVRLGVRDQIDVLIDSGIVGVEKPDPRIFQLALDAAGVTADETLHLGDSISTDVRGARASGIRVALIDPYGHCEGRALDVLRVSGVAEVADALGDRWETAVS